MKSGKKMLMCVAQVGDITKPYDNGNITMLNVGSIIRVQFHRDGFIGIDVGINKRLYVNTRITDNQPLVRELLRILDIDTTAHRAGLFTLYEYNIISRKQYDAICRKIDNEEAAK